MQFATVYAQLAEIRATLRRLKYREDQIEKIIPSAAPIPAASRPGWPIQRAGTAEQHAN